MQNKFGNMGKSVKLNQSGQKKEGKRYRTSQKEPKMGNSVNLEQHWGNERKGQKWKKKEKNIRWASREREKVQTKVTAKEGSNE